MSTKGAVRDKSGTFLTVKKNYAKFDGRGMTVDLDGYLRTQKGGMEFKSLARSAFSPTKKTAQKK